MLPVVALTVVGGVVRFVGLGSQSFWIDEIITAELVAKPFTEMLRAIPDADRRHRSPASSPGSGRRPSAPTGRGCAPSPRLPVIVAWLPFALVIGAALGAKRAGALGLVAASALVVWSLGVLAHHQTTPTLQRDDWRQVADAPGAPDGQIVLLSPSRQIALSSTASPTRASSAVGRSRRS